MKILFHNYATPVSTESRYLTASMQNAGLEADIWANPQVSAYDMLDGFNPDVLVGHYKFLTSDMVKYLSNSTKKLVLNVTGATQAELLSVETLCDKLDLPFCFTNDFKFNVKSDPNRKFKIHTILPAADIFLSKKPKNPNSIIGLIGSEITKEMSPIINGDKPHHLICTQENQNFDFTAHSAQLSDLYSLYSKVIISGKIDLLSSQLFFDSCLNSHSLEVLPIDSEKVLWSEFLEMVFEEPPTDAEKKDMTTTIKNQIMRNHLPFNRAQKLLELLGDNESAKKIENISKNIVKTP